MNWDGLMIRSTSDDPRGVPNKTAKTHKTAKTNKPTGPAHTNKTAKTNKPSKPRGK